MPKCQKVACGYAYSCAVTVDGNIYSWGAGENGRLGTGSSQDELTPVLVTTDWKAINIFAGSVHTCAIGESGQMYTWGTSVLCRFVVGPCWTVLDRLSRRPCACWLTVVGLICLSPPFRA